MLEYNLELDKVIKEIKASKAKRVAIQLPAGLKPKAVEIVDKLQSKTKAEIFIWAGSDFGACDLPLSLQSLNIDLIIAFGHSQLG